MKRILTCAVLLTACIGLGAQAPNRFAVTLTAPGTLEAQVLALDANKVEGLTISGPLGGADLAFLHTPEGVMASVRYLDLSAATLAPDDVAYATSVVAPPAGMGTTYVTTYYLSVTPREEPGRSSPTTVRTNRYCNDLSALFSGNTALREVKWPVSMTQVGAGAFSACAALEQVSLPAGVTAIGSSAFSGCQALKALSLPEGLTTVGDQAFSGAGLDVKQLDLPQVTSVGAQAFAQTKVQEVRFGAALRHLGEAVFSSCDSLRAVTFTGALDSVPAQTFYNCDSLRSVVLPAGLRFVGANAFYGCTSLALDLPESIEQIGNGAFAYTDIVDALPYEGGIRYVGRVAYERDGSSNLTDVAIREGTVSLSAELFKYSQLQRISLPASLRFIGPDCFASCPMAEIELPAGLEEIGEWAFNRCTNLTHITLPESLRRVGYLALADCPALWSITYLAADATVNQMRLTSEAPVQRVTLGAGVRRVPAGLYTGNTKLTELTLPPAVERIDADAFQGCTALRKVSVPDGLRHIGAGAFEGTALADFNWPSQLQSVGALAFAHTKLREAQLPEGLQQMWWSSIYSCDSLTTLYLPSTLSIEEADGLHINFGAALRDVTCALAEVPSWTLDLNYRIVNSGDYIIRVPSASVEAYRAAWPKYAARIIAIGDIEPPVGISGAPTMDGAGRIVAYYTLGGRRVAQPTAGGTYIVRLADGSCRKVVVPAQ